jgi:hypothetical protein
MLLNVKARGNHSYNIEKNYGTIRSYEHWNCCRLVNTDTLQSKCYVRLSIATHDGGGGGGGAPFHLSRLLLRGY